jgi:PAS domain S-box-containing protein
LSARAAQTTGAPSRLTIPPDLACLAEVRTWSWEVGSSASLPEARIFDLQVTVSEATANAIEHAASAVELTAWLLSDRVIVEVTNDGVFQPGLYKDDVHRRRGLGLPLIVSLADQVHVSRLPSDKTEISLTFFLDADRALTAPAEAPLAGEQPVKVAAARSNWQGDAAESEPLGKFERSAWLFIPLIILAIAVVRAFGMIAAPESSVLFTTFSAIFLSGACLTIAFLAARSFRLSASLTLLFFGSAGLLLGLTYLVAGPLVTNRNALTTVHNLGFLVTAILFVLSAVWSLDERLPRPDTKRTVPLLVSAYVAVVAFLALISSLAANSLLPAFYVEGQGYTVVRSVLFGFGIAGFLVASYLFLLLYRRLPSRFLLWVCAGLALIGASTGAAVLAGATGGTVIAWLSRVGQWLGGLFLLMGVLSLEGRAAWVLPLERNLHEVEDRYKNLVDLSPDAILVDAGGQHVFANPAAARLYGAQSPRELIGKNPLDYVQPEDHELVRQRMGEVAAGAVATPREVRMLGLDGTTFTAEVTASRVLFGGRLANQVVIRDLTARKQAEETLRRSNEKYRGLFENSYDAIVIYRYVLDEAGEVADFVFEEVNTAAEAAVGMKREELVGKTFAQVFGDELIGRCLPFVSQMRKEDRAVRYDDTPNYVPHLDRYFVTTYVPLDGERFIASSTDITERWRAEEALRESREGYRALAAENERLYRQQLDIADNLQSALLHIPAELGTVRLGHLYRSATEAARVGGDFYDVFEVKEGKIALLIGDVAGHGIEAARTATLVKDVVHAFIHQSLRTHEVLRQTNRLLIEKELPGHVTLFLGIFDTHTGQLRYSSAGHPEMVVRRAASGEVEGLGVGAAPLGIYADGGWKPHAVELTANDLLVLFTDGVVEARRNGELFGEKRLHTLIKRRHVSPERLPHVILDQVLAFSGGTLQDDVAILTLLVAEKGDGARVNGTNPA